MVKRIALPGIACALMLAISLFLPAAFADSGASYAPGAASQGVAATAAKSVTFKGATFKESAKYLNNPYRGFYAITAYTLTEDASEDRVAKRLAHDLKSGEYKGDLVLVEFNLKNYNGRDGNPAAIGKRGLSQVSRVLARWDKAGKHVIVRLLYDSASTTVDDISLAGDAAAVEPEKLSVLKGHIAQVAPTINAHKRCVYMVQGTSMGAWGEMHTSSFTPDVDGSRKVTHANIKSVLKHMGKKIDKSIFLAVRRPSYYRAAVAGKALTAKTGFKGTLAARVSLFNDGMFGSESDSGTYDKSRKSEVAFQSQHCQFVPNGGEAITLGKDGAGREVTGWNRFSTTATGARKAYGKSLVADLRAMHVSYLNKEYHDLVIADWKAAKYTGADAYKGLSGMDYIERHLGYRYVLCNATARTSGTTAKVALQVENVGFSPAYRSMKSQLSLVNAKGKVVKRFAISSDNRFWKPGAKTKLSKTLKLKGVPAGTYTLRYSLTDPTSGKQIALANTAKQTSAGYILGTLAINN